VLCWACQSKEDIAKAVSCQGRSTIPKVGRSLSFAFGSPESQVPQPVLSPSERRPFALQDGAVCSPQLSLANFCQSQPQAAATSFLGIASEAHAESSIPGDDCMSDASLKESVDCDMHDDMEMGSLSALSRRMASGQQGQIMWGLGCNDTRFFEVNV
jgi:hypothetical protein